ncbi:MAG: ferredoxin [Candidatus Gracilibacteria bacterium]|nr:ferredoxin [Candidatus Gracilibacteria bacterium]
MKIRIPKVINNCVGCGACVSISPDVFEMNMDGLSQVIENKSYEDKNVDDAIKICPVNAIKWTEMEIGAKDDSKCIKNPKVNNNCIGCGACVSISPDVFFFNENGLSEALILDSYEGKNIDDCIAACPVSAISWE